MPCVTEPPSHREIEQKRLNDLLDEVGDTTPKSHHGMLGWTRGLELDVMTNRLCEWSRVHDVTTRSLEFQIWWRDHQKWDAQREANEQRAKEREQLRQDALKKLTPAELDAIKGGR